uniref:BHLH domain-containing protein n=1 Tax=Parascaris equorum TaxID=6256 RepID=A0A914S4U5_PAREQ
VHAFSIRLKQSSLRSTRGASKQRRDQINIEIQKLRDLLPLSDSIKDRLFQLQVMSLACIFIRKQRYLPHILGARSVDAPIGQSTVLPLRQIDACKALRGFLLMFTKSGKLLHISENASEYLGHSV